MQHTSFLKTTGIYKLILLFSVVNLQGQVYPPIDTLDQVYRSEAKARFELRQQHYEVHIKAKYRGELRRRYNKELAIFAEDFSEAYTNGRFIFNHPFNNLVDSLAQLILLSNPQVEEEFDILVSKDVNLNAFCLHDGTIVLFMGTIAELNNEQQLAGILAHEMAHKLLKHNESAQIWRIHNEISQKLHPSYEQLKSQKYGRQQLALERLRDQVYANQKIRRYNEHQADSLGFVLFTNAGFTPEDYLGIFDHFHHSDSFTVKGVVPETLRKYFTTPGQEFDDSWIDISDIDIPSYDAYKGKLDKDSVSTHPEASQRTAYLMEHFEGIHDSMRLTSPASSYFKHLSTTAAYHMVPNLFYAEDFGLAAFLCLKNLQEGFETAQHSLWLGQALTKLLEARKEYKLNRHLEQINPRKHHEDYMRFLKIMWDLSNNELQQIADHLANHQ